MKKFIGLIAVLFIVAFSVTSCRTAVVVRPRPVAFIKPRPVIYVRPVAPAPAYVWVDGGWVSNRRHGYYRQGYWAAPRRY